MDNDITVLEERSPAPVKAEMQWTPDQEKLIIDTVCRGATREELQLFLYICKRTGLDPFTKQIYSVARWDSKMGREVRTTQTGIDGFRVVAERSNKYAGQLGPFWCGKDGVWLDVWLNSEPPLAAKVGVLRSDFKEPLWGVANWESYAQKFFNKKSGQFELSKFWKDLGPLMIAKVAEALALRKSFPQDLSGIYESSEIRKDEQAQEAIEPPKPSREVESAIKEIAALCKEAIEKHRADRTHLLNKVIITPWDALNLKTIIQIDTIKARVKDYISQLEVNNAAENLAANLDVSWNDENE